MPQSKLTADGRTTVPAAVRAQLDMKAGTRLTWTVMPADGTIIVRAKTRSILDVAGILVPPAGVVHVTIEEMNAWQRRG
jgi:bifunctional DNA-binding transcriptional regulator/antitoxin component of YhaV-PrlF toxin-antitoxin module